jgi:hypothetical protein
MSMIRADGPLDSGSLRSAGVLSAHRMPTKRSTVAIIRLIQPQGMTREAYDAVDAKVGVEADPPEGLIMHCAGEAGGTWQIVEVWESEEDALRFDTDRLGPAIAEVTGDSGAPPSGPAVYEVHHLVLL